MRHHSWKGEGDEQTLGFWVTAKPVGNADPRLLVRTNWQPYAEGQSRHTSGLVEPLERSCFRHLRKLLDELEAKALDEPEIW